MSSSSELRALANSASILSRQLNIDLLSPSAAEEMLADATRATNAALTVADRLGLRAAAAGAAKRGGFENDAQWFGHVTQQNEHRASRRLKTARIFLGADDDFRIPWMNGAYSSEQADFLADNLDAPAPPPPPPDPEPKPNNPKDDEKRKRAEARRRGAEKKRKEELLKAAAERRLSELRAKAAATKAANRNGVRKGRQSRFFWSKKEEGGYPGRILSWCQ